MSYRGNYSIEKIATQVGQFKSYAGKTIKSSGIDSIINEFLITDNPTLRLFQPDPITVDICSGFSNPMIPKLKLERLSQEVFVGVTDVMMNYDYKSLNGIRWTYIGTQEAINACYAFIELFVTLWENDILLSQSQDYIICFGEEPNLRFVIIPSGDNITYTQDTDHYRLGIDSLYLRCMDFLINQDGNSDINLQKLADALLFNEFRDDQERGIFERNRNLINEVVLDFLNDLRVKQVPLRDLLNHKLFAGSQKSLTKKATRDTIQVIPSQYQDQFVSYLDEITNYLSKNHGDMKVEFLFMALHLCYQCNELILSKPTEYMGTIVKMIPSDRQTNSPLDRVFPSLKAQAIDIIFHLQSQNHRLYDNPFFLAAYDGPQLTTIYNYILFNVEIYPLVDIMAYCNAMKKSGVSKDMTIRQFLN